MPIEAQKMVADVGIAYVATVTPDGLPNLSPKGSLKVVDAHTLAFGEMTSPGTMRNLHQMPFVEINVLDVFKRHGYRFRGRADIVEDPDLIEFLGAGLGADYPIRSAVRVTVQETRALVSPIYWVTDNTEEDVVQIWERKLGYTRTAPNGARSR
jgi:uncharacterized protein